MYRRTAIRNVLIISAGTAFLPVACRHTEKTGISVNGIPLSAGEQDMLAALTETIIPQTNTFPGAEDLKCHEFVLLMVNDCTAPEEQKIFMNGLKGFDTVSKKKSGKTFTSCTNEQKYVLLTAIESKKDIPDEVLKFYETVKRYTLQSFTSSKKYMQDIKKYVMVPGPSFKGCVLIKNN